MAKIYVKCGVLLLGGSEDRNPVVDVISNDPNASVKCHNNICRWVRTSRVWVSALDVYFVYIYVLIYEGHDWEDIVILLSKEEAINESIKYPEARVEIFSKSNNLGYGGYRPTYNYYKNGELVQF